MSYNKQIQTHIEEYRRTVNNGPVTSREIALWLIRESKWEPSLDEAADILTRDVSDALRTQFTTDADGRRVRRKHAVRYKETLTDGTKQQLTLWYDIEIAPPHFMLQSFQQRREGIAGDCWQLKQDVDSYNKFHNNAAPIQMLLDFTEDMEERGLSGDYPPPEAE